MVQIEVTKKKNPPIFIVMGIVLSCLVIGTSLLVLFFPFPSKEKTTYTTMKYPIVTNGHIFEENAIYENGILYFPFSYIKDNIDNGLIIDEDSNSIILTTHDKVFQMPSDSLTYFVNEEPHQLEFPIYKTEGNTSYLSIDPFLPFYNIQYKFNGSTGITIVRKEGDSVQTGNIRSEQREAHYFMRSEPSLTSPYIAQTKAKEPVYIEKEVDGFYYVRKENGTAGYVKKSLVTVEATKKLHFDEKEKLIPPLQAHSLPVNLTWEAVYTKNPDTTKIPNMPGLNVISPTWFSLKNKEGDINNLGSTAYIKWAKSKKLEIWGLFSNDFDPDKTHEAFKDFETRKKMIRQLLEYSAMYELHGINIDIENVYEEDGPFVTQFVKEATPYFHEAGLVVSMDVTFISDSGTWSKFYERDQLATIVDYMIVMAYDEHWSSSPLSGSVASLPWVEKNLQKMLKLVPNERLILGIPLYTRLWKEADTEGGNIEVSSKAYSMGAIEQWIAERKLQITYDETSGQNYVEYRDEEEKATYKVWLEDEQSLNKRVQLMHKYDLAGVASWSRFFANDTAWTTITQSLEETEVVNK